MKKRVLFTFEDVITMAKGWQKYNTSNDMDDYHGRMKPEAGKCDNCGKPASCYKNTLPKYYCSDYCRVRIIRMRKRRKLIIELYKNNDKRLVHYSIQTIRDAGLRVSVREKLI